MEPAMSNKLYSHLGNVVIKGKEEDGKWVVYLQASNELKDQEGETVRMDALKKASDYYLSHGILSWDHKHKQTSNPGYIIGEPMEVQFNPEGQTMVKGFLYKQNKIAAQLWDNIQSGARRLGASIGGGILQKSDSNIERVVWDETAITHKPVNDGTLGTVQTVPFKEFAKALMAGSGLDAASFSGGRALTPEGMQGSGREPLPFQWPLEPYDKEKLDGLVKVHIEENQKEGIPTSLNSLAGYIHNLGFESTLAVKLARYYGSDDILPSVF